MTGTVYKSNGTDPFKEIKGTSGLISALTTDNVGNVYASGVNGVYKSNGTDQFTTMSGTSGEILSLTSDKDGNVYAGGVNGNVYKSY